MARAAGDGIRVSRFDIEDGLSQNTVLSIIQDRKGDMWFATNDGLTRYDGYDFTVFRHSARDTSSIADNNVRLLFIDSSDRLWVGTAYGLCRYDSSLENFDSFGTGTGLDIYALEEISGDRLLVGTSDRMFVFDISSGCFSDTLPAAAASLRARSMVKYGGSIFIGCADGELYEYSISDSRFNRINVPECGKPVQYILIQEPGILWAGTEGDGLYRIILKDGTVTNFRYDEAPGHLGSNYVRALANDSEGRLWVGIPYQRLSLHTPTILSTMKACRRILSAAYTMTGREECGSALSMEESTTGILLKRDSPAYGASLTGAR